MQEGAIGEYIVSDGRGACQAAGHARFAIRLTKQEYIECRLLDESVTVVPSSRIAASLSQWMQAIYRELITARDEERALDADVVWMARSIAEEFSAISSAGQTRNANETMRSIERS